MAQIYLANLLARHIINGKYPEGNGEQLYDLAKDMNEKINNVSKDWNTGNFMFTCKKSL